MVNIYIPLEQIKLKENFDLPMLFATTPHPSHTHVSGWVQVALEIILKQYTILKNYRKSASPLFIHPPIRHERVRHTME